MSGSRTVVEVTFRPQQEGWKREVSRVVADEYRVLRDGRLNLYAAQSDISDDPTQDRPMRAYASDSWLSVKRETVASEGPRFSGAQGFQHEHDTVPEQCSVCTFYRAREGYIPQWALSDHFRGDMLRAKTESARLRMKDAAMDMPVATLSDPRIGGGTKPPASEAESALRAEAGVVGLEPADKPGKHSEAAKAVDPKRVWIGSDVDVQCVWCGNVGVLRTHGGNAVTLGAKQ